MVTPDLFSALVIGATILMPAPLRSDPDPASPALPAPVETVPILVSGETTCGPSPTICPDEADPWPTWPILFETTVSPTIEAKLAIRQQVNPVPVTLNPVTFVNEDTLFLYITITDFTDDQANDHLTFHLRTGPSTIRGIRFHRDGTVVFNQGNPITPVTVPGSITTLCDSFSTTTRLCIGNDPDFNPNRWIIEAKLVPSDFGLNAFAGLIPAYVRAVDSSGGTSGWDGNADTVDPINFTTWATLDLGAPVDLALVLDYSGSMAWRACSDPACKVKELLLEEAVHNFLAIYSAAAVPADKVGVQYFRQDVSPHPHPGLRNVINEWATIANEVEMESAVGWTAMGAGLQSSINLLKQQDTARSQVIVLVTDGVQNVSPAVTQSDCLTLCRSINSYPLKICNVTGLDGGASLNISAEPTPTELESSQDFAVYVIVIGPITGDYQDCLTDIAGKTNGEYQSTLNVDQQLREFFANVLVSALRDHSPQLLAYRRGQLDDQTATEKFAANRTSQQIILNLSWHDADSLWFEVVKDGVPIPDSVANVIRGESYRVFSLHLPATVGGSVIQPGGTWEMLISGRRDSDYEAAAISNELALEYDVSLGGAGVAVGDPLELDARLTVAGEPLTDARVTAILNKPELGIGTLLSINNVQIPPDFTLEPGATPAQNKLHLLLQNPAHFEDIQPLEQALTLESAGDGSYSMKFDGVDVPGSYTVTFYIEGENDDLGTYRREKTVSTYVRFSEADLDLSDLHAIAVSVSPEGPTHVIHVRPRDRFGNYLGPDHGHQVNVTLSQGTVHSEDMLDLVDGSYEIPITVPANTDPDVVVTVMKEPLSGRPLSAILKTVLFQAGVYGGAAVPTGSFGNGFDPGFNVMAGVGYHVSHRVLVGVFAGYNDFTSNVAGVDDTYWINVSGNIRYRVTSSPLAPFVGLGPGLYISQGGTLEGGGNIGAGFVLDHGSRVFEVGADYHRLFGTSIEFIHVHAGVAFKL